MDLIARRAFDRLSKACQAVARDVSAFDRVSAACDDGERLIDQMSTWSLTPAEEKRFGDWRQRFNVFRLAITAFKHGLEGKYPEGIQLFTGAIDAITEDPTKPTLHQLEGLTLRNLKRKARSMNVVEDQIDDLDDFVALSFIFCNCERLIEPIYGTHIHVMWASFVSLTTLTLLTAGVAWIVIGISGGLNRTFGLHKTRWCIRHGCP